MVLATLDLIARMGKNPDGSLVINNSADDNINGWRPKKEKLKDPPVVRTRRKKDWAT